MTVRVLLLVVAFGVIPIATSSTVVLNRSARGVPAAVEELRLLGNSFAGSVFYRTCPANHVLTGFRYRTGLTLDGISIKCRPVRSDGTLGAEVLAGSWAGGSGGTLANKSCPANYVVAGQDGNYTPPPTLTLTSVRFDCFRWSATSRAWFGTGQRIDLLALGIEHSSEKCSASARPGTGIRGRHGAIIDAIGLVCNAP